MRKLRSPFLVLSFTLIFTSGLTVSAPAAFMRENCQCTASDNSCSVSMTCEGGCQAYCNPQGDCVAFCSGRQGYLGGVITANLVNGTYPQLVDELSRVSGQKISYIPRKPNILINIDSKNGALWDMLSHLSDRGELQVAGQDFSKIRKLRRDLLSGGKVNFCVRETPIEMLVSDLANLTGLRLRVAAGSTAATVTGQFRDVSLSEILDAASEQTGSTIVNEGPAFVGR